MILVNNVEISETNYGLAVAQIRDWVQVSESRYVIVANVHVLMEAYDALQFRHVVNSADLVVPDGMPLVWMMRIKGANPQERVYGPTLMLRVLEVASRENIPVGFYGAEEQVLKALVKKMEDYYSDLRVAYAYSPPFRALSTYESSDIIEKINTSGAKILFVGLGCPKQENWMAEHRGKINAVMLGVGAAFDFHAGTKPQAPVWLQKIGLEWLYRLINEPHRLWYRYFYNNPRFVFLAAIELFEYFLGKRP